MRRRVLLKLSLILFISSVSGLVGIAQSTGLRFIGQEHFVDDRTSLELFTKKPLKISGDFNISFDLELERNYHTYFGYIFRMISEDGQNIDLILDNIDQDSVMMNLIVGDHAVILTFPIEKKELHRWNEVDLLFNLSDSAYAMRIGDHFAEGSGGSIDPKSQFSIYFGVNHLKEIETTDLPNMMIRDIIFRQNSRKLFHWPLDDISGDITHDIVSNRKATLTNPYWLHQDHVEWQLVNSFSSQKPALITYDEALNRFFIVTPDSLITYDASRMEVTNMVGFTDNLTLESGHGLIFNKYNNTLLWYVVDDKLLSSYDFSANSWSKNLDYDPELTTFWQHNRFIDPVDYSLKIFGGYGLHTYKNLVQSADLRSNVWTETEPDHEKFQPRYLAGLGTNQAADTVYILGGYGSLDGDQKLKPGYWNELIRYLPSEGTFEHIRSYPEEVMSHFCISNSIILQEDQFYALAYSKFEYENDLQLFKGSISNDKMEPLAALLPFSFHDVGSFVDLHYSKEEQKLYASILRTLENETSTIDIYSLNFPPEIADNILFSKAANNSLFLFILLAILIVVAPTTVVFLLRRRRKGQHKQSQKPETATSDQLMDVEKEDPANQTASNRTPEIPPTEDRRKNRILLFGGFQIINGEGKDITARFTPLLKEMFLLIFLNSFGERKGVSSEYLREILWSDKTSKDARNNRAVNMSKLKNLLMTVGETTISKETGYWKVHVNTSKVYVDYYELNSIVHSDKVDRDDIVRLTEIARSKPFLHNINNEWIDVFKAEVSNLTVDTFVNWAMENISQCKPAFIIDIADAIFEFDTVNEEAMELKCKSLVKLGKHSMAKSTYDQFIKEYELLYAEKFRISFNELIEKGL